MQFPDSYTLRARVWPLLLAASPLLVLAVATARLKLGPAIGSAALGAAAVFLGSQFARDVGKKLEPQLWANWGGAPTLQRLTFAGAQSRISVERAHAAVERATGLTLPTEAAEASDAEAAKAAYEHATLRLREMTRDPARFGLLFKENVNYGFRRNLLGLKPLGIGATITALLAATVIVILTDGNTGARIVAVAVPSIWSVLALLVWWRLIKPDWVRVPADAYAERLIGCAELLDHEVSAARRADTKAEGE
jgi:hypothetical protein